MIFTPTPIAGVLLVDVEPRADQRGFFARTWCQQEFADHGLCPQFAQCGVSFSPAAGTLRGLHYQAPPHAEAKLVRCTQGAIYDVAVDLRPRSPTLHQWFAAELTAANHRMLYIPEGCAHGFLTLADNTEVFYQMSHAHRPEAAGGVRWDDPTLAIRWPGGGARVISDRDRALPLLANICPSAARGPALCGAEEPT